MTTVPRSRPRGQLPVKKASPTLGSLIVLPRGAVSLVVLGRPAPQGSKSPLGMEANPRTRPWREMIAKVCRNELPADWEKMDGPLDVEMWFFFDPPASAKPGDLPCTKTTYDLDKLQRALDDGLTVGGVITDDSRVVDMHAFKRYVFKGEGEARAVVVISQHRS